ncbi:MAG: sensor histidine kinase [Snowella sp.]|nr:sensor histidine kinase [Snowella sp.]
MLRKFWQKSIKFKLLLPFSLLSLVIVGTMSVVAYSMSRRELQNGVFERLNIVIQMKESELKNWIKDQSKDVYIAANDLQQIKWLGQELLTNSMTASAQKKTCQSLSQNFDRISGSKTNLQNIYLLTINGEILCSNRTSLIGQYQPVIASGTFFTPETINDIKPIIYVSPLTQQRTITLVTPFLNMAGTQIGFFSVDLDLKSLDQLLQESTHISSIHNILLIASNSNLLEAKAQFFTDSLLNIKVAEDLKSPAIAAALEGQKGEKFYRNHENIRVLGAYRPLSNRLILIAETDQRQAFLPAFRITKEIISIGLLFSAIALGLVYLISEQLTKPIRSLTQIVLALGEGNFNARVKNYGEDEVGILARTLNSMSDSLQTTFQQLTEQKQLAEAANRAKNAFLANMSHELRTPLNAIIGYSEMLEEEVSDRDEEDLIPDLHKIQTAGKNLLGIVNNVLDISKLESGQMEVQIETFSLISLINEVVASSQLLIEQNHNQIRVNYPENLGTMAGDFTKIRQCLLILLSNAAKFTTKGTIDFSIDRDFADDHEWIRFEVQDTGIGIAPDKHNCLFVPFSQVDTSSTRPYDGAGLGLAIAKQYCQLMGGEITLESELGKGSIFQIKLPATLSP